MRSVCLCVCVCVCLSVSAQHVSRTALLIFTKFFAQIPCGHGSILFWQRCNTLCTSSFMDDVTFGHSGPYGGRCDTGAESDVYECLIRRVSASFVNCLI